MRGGDRQVVVQAKKEGCRRWRKQVWRSQGDIYKAAHSIRDRALIANCERQRASRSFCRPTMKAARFRTKTVKPWHGAGPWGL